MRKEYTEQEIYYVCGNYRSYLQDLEYVPDLVKIVTNLFHDIQDRHVYLGERYLILKNQMLQESETGVVGRAYAISLENREEFLPSEPVVLFDEFFKVFKELVEAEADNYGDCLSSAHREELLSIEAYKQFHCVDDVYLPHSVRVTFNNNRTDPETLVLGHYKMTGNYEENIKTDILDLFHIIQDVHSIVGGSIIDESLISETSLVGFSYIEALNEYDDNLLCIVPFDLFWTKLQDNIRNAEKEYGEFLRPFQKEVIFK